MKPLIKYTSYDNREFETAQEAYDYEELLEGNITKTLAKAISLIKWQNFNYLDALKEKYLDWPAPDESYDNLYFAIKNHYSCGFCLKYGFSVENHIGCEYCEFGKLAGKCCDKDSLYDKIENMNHINFETEEDFEKEQDKLKEQIIETIKSI